MGKKDDFTPVLQKERIAQYWKKPATEASSDSNFRALPIFVSKESQPKIYVIDVRKLWIFKNIR